MTDPNLQTKIEAAEAYEELFIPALFGEWAPRVADAAGVGDGERVLDVGCGTGILAREAALRVGQDGMVAGVDPNPGMLTVAQRLAPTVEWREGMGEWLPFQGASLDISVGKYGRM
jgi:ubiquinone/menaquinone biosynthesis C-methylase UbiE